MDSFQFAAKRFKLQRVNLIKFVHSKLPTAEIRQYTDPSVQILCQKCFSEDDTFLHHLRCPARSKWRDSFLVALNRFCSETPTDPNLKTCLVQSFISWFDGSLIDPLEYDPPFRTLIRHQSKIGWYSMLRGFTSCMWTQIQQEYLYSNDLITKTQTGTNWTTKLICLFWTHALRLWQEYSDDLAGPAQVNHVQRQKATLIAKIRQYHLRRSELLPADRRWLMSDP